MIYSQAASQDKAVSTTPSELVAVQAILEVYKPQRLRQIFASLCYLLAYNTDPQDYYFIVDPVDRPNLAGRGLEEFERLINTSTNSAIRLVSTGDPICRTAQSQPGLIIVQQLIIRRGLYRISVPEQAR